MEPTRAEHAAGDDRPSRALFGALVAFVAVVYLAAVHFVLPAFVVVFGETGIALPALTLLVLQPALWPLASTALILALAAVALCFRGRRVALFLVLHLVAVAAVVIFALFLPIGGIVEPP